jgi:AcrR family transcriptional regulator
MPSDEPSTRDKLLDAAARLFAERGVENVSLAEVVREAGQRNTSAVHYHFGRRDDLVLALLELYVPVIRARRLELLALAEAKPDDARRAAEAVVRPVTEFAQRGWRERAYLQIGTELMHRLDRVPKDVRHTLRQTAGYEAMTLLSQRCPPLPPEIWAERSELLYPFIGRAAADRARRLGQRAGRDRATLSDDRFVNNLVDMLLGALTAPVTDAEPSAVSRRHRAAHATNA